MAVAEQDVAQSENGTSEPTPAEPTPFAGENRSHIWAAELAVERFIPPTNWKDGEEWRPADDISDIVQRIIKAFPGKFDHLTSLRIASMWKRNGRTKSGRAILGKAQVTRGLTLHFFDGAEFWLWIAADHVMEQSFSHTHLEALVFSLLLSMVSDEEGKLTISAPDFTGFIAEVQEYGIWRPELKDGAKAFESVTLPLFGES